MSGENLWQSVSTAAVLGTQRRPVQLPEQGSALSSLLHALPGAGDPQAETLAEDVLLGALAVTAIHHRAGRLPQAGIPRRFPPCPPDICPRCTPRAAVFLQAMLAGRQRSLLAEWIELAAAHQQRIPEEHVEAIIAHKQFLNPCRAVFAQVLGERGRWMMEQVRELFGTPSLLGFGLHSDESYWHDGSHSERVNFLSDLRLHDPRRAAALLAESWQQEGYAAKVMLLQTLGETLTAEDEPFLESALNDRRQEVRAAAANLLARLPESRLVARMTARARGLLSWKSGLLRSTLEARLPKECDAEMQRDGILPRPPQDSQLGEKAGLLAQVLALVPPRVWSAAWNRRPGQILDVARKHEWEAALLWGWEEAAMRCQDAEWLEALMAHEMRFGKPHRALQLFARLPDEARERQMIGLLRDIAPLSFDQQPSLYLSRYQQAWSPELTQAVTSAICRTIQKGETPPWHWEKLLRDIPPYFHPDLLKAAAQRITTELERRPEGDPYAAGLVEALNFRLEMRRSFIDTLQRE